MATEPRNGGFTLIEILIVLGILAALLTVATPVLFKSRESAERKTTGALIQQIRVAVKHRMNSPKFGDAPPSRLALAGFESTNDLNEGIEALVATLGAEDSELNPFDDEDRLENLDGDRDPKKMTFGKSKQFFEYVDAWFNPLVYFRLRDFEEDGKKSVRYTRQDGTTIEVSPIISAKTGGFAGALDGFQIISLGPDEEFGTDDDVVSWSSK